MSEEFKKEFNPKITNKYGKVYEIVVDMDFEMFKSNAQKYSPILLEKLDMTLEEIFLFKMGGDNNVKQITI